MRFTYLAAANNTTTTKTLSDGSTSTTAGTPLGSIGQDVYVKKLFIGKVIGSANITFFSKTVAFPTDTSDIAFKLTLPATITSSKEYDYPTEVDFSFSGHSGLQLDGGIVMCDQACQLTVLWEPVDEAV